MPHEYTEGVDEELSRLDQTEDPDDQTEDPDDQTEDPDDQTEDPKKGKKSKRNPFAIVVRPPMSATRRRIVEKRQDAFAAFRKEHAGAEESDGFYFSTFEVKWTGDATANSVTAGFYIDPSPGSPTVFKAFDKAIDDTGLRGNNQAYVWTLSDTNLQRAGENLYRDELFSIEAISIKQTGYYVTYNDAAITALLGANSITAQQEKVLKGQKQLFDDGAVFLPAELWSEYTGQSLITRAIYQTSTLLFTWTKRAGGGGSGTDEIPVKALDELLDRRTGFTESSGGAIKFGLDNGYLWTQRTDQNNSYSGTFDARISVSQDTYFPVKAVKIPSSATNPITPEGLSVLYRVTLHGRVIRPRNPTANANLRKK